MNENNHIDDRYRKLTSRHISFISFGGIIGTGLFLGVKNTLVCGPIFSLFSYCYISVICFYIIQAVGEMSCFMPVTGSLCQFQFRFVSEQVGVMNNFIYWLSWSITLGLELSLICSVVQYWLVIDQTRVILIVWVMLTIVNLLPSNYYGEIEFIITILKVVFIICWLMISIFLIPRIGFVNWKETREIAIGDFFSSLVSSCFTFQSIESVALCSGDIKDIHKSLPRAIKYIISRIVVFYILTLLLLTLMISSNDPRLNNEDIMSSPFLIGLMNLGVDEFLDLFNFIILVSMISAANSNIYFGSRCILSMVEEGYMMSVFGWRIGSVPYMSVMITSGIGLGLSLLSRYKSINEFFKLLINLSSTSGLLMWLFISVSYIRWRKALEYNSLDYSRLNYTSRLNMVWMSYFTMISVVLIILSNGWSNLIRFNWDSFISSYLTSILMGLGWVYLSYKWKSPFFIPVEFIDLESDQSNHAFE